MSLLGLTSNNLNHCAISGLCLTLKKKKNFKDFCSTLYEEHQLYIQHTPGKQSIIMAPINKVISMLVWQYYSFNFVAPYISNFLYIMIFCHFAFCQRKKMSSLQNFVVLASLNTIRMAHLKNEETFTMVKVILRNNFSIRMIKSFAKLVKRF